jgi:opacity protein-like surface antigen
MTMRIIWLALAVSVAAPCRLAAQEHGQIGVTMGYPAAVGVLWQVTDRVAVRPDVSFSGASADTGADSLLGPLATSNRTLGVGIAALMTVKRWDALRAYVAPRFQYTRSHTESESVSESFSFSTIPNLSVGLSPITPISIIRHSETTTTTTSGSGAFGVSYAPHKRFSVYGEVGVGYSSSDATATVTPALPIELGDIGATHRWAIQSGIGVVFYFKD